MQGSRTTGKHLKEKLQNNCLSCIKLQCISSVLGDFFENPPKHFEALSFSLSTFYNNVVCVKKWQFKVNNTSGTVLNTALDTVSDTTSDTPSGQNVVLPSLYFAEDFDDKTFLLQYKASTCPKAATLPQPDCNPLDISECLHYLLSLRQLTQHEEIHKFLSPNLRLLAPLELWPGVLDGAKVIVRCLKEGQKLAVWGDYDVDGITSSCLVQDVLEAHGFDIFTHIPDRTTEGYGLNCDGIDALFAQGVRILLTVDCGISDYEAVAHAKALGMTVVVSDHHLPPSRLPPADVLCNPQLAPCPCAYLAGVGVAFFLMCAVNKLLQEHTGKEYDMREVLDLVALGTLADVVTLKEQNRILVKNGLLKIAAATRPGMAALKKVARFDMAAKMGAGQVVFTLAPRINAAGRMGHARRALALLRAPNLDVALPLARELDAMNAQRKEEENRIHQEARVQALAQKDRAGLVLYAPDWHQGIIGIVASRILEEFYKPTLILCDGLAGIKGSGRSIKEFHLYEGLTELSDILLGFGGHKLAAGLSVDKENLDVLKERFDSLVRESFGEEKPAPTLKIDAILDFSLASDATFLREVELMQPFGMGNAEPVFVSPTLYVVSTRLFGYQKEHLAMDVRDESTGITLQAKVWRRGAELKHLANQYVRFAYTPKISTYNGISSVEVQVKDWKLEKRHHTEVQ